MKVTNAAKNIQKYLDANPEMTQREFSEKVGITQAALSQILAGTRIPSLETTIKIMKAMKIKFEELFK